MTSTEYVGRLQMAMELREVPLTMDWEDCCAFTGLTKDG